MATIKIGGNDIETVGNLPAVGSTAPDFKLLQHDLSTASLADFKGKRVVLNIFPSVDTTVCATSVKNFNKRATDLENTSVLSISRDTPFAMKRFNDSEDIDNVTSLSDVIDGKFGEDYGLTMITGPMAGFHSRAVIVLDTDGKVIYNQQVPEIGEEPDYLAALKVLV